MRDPLKIKLEHLASTYGIDPLGLAWIQVNADGSRSLVLSPVPEKGVTLLGTFTAPVPEVHVEPLTEDEVSSWTMDLYR